MSQPVNNAAKLAAQELKKAEAAIKAAEEAKKNIAKNRETVFMEVNGKIAEQAMIPETLVDIVNMHQQSMRNNVNQTGETLEVIVRIKSPKRPDNESYFHQANTLRKKTSRGTAPIIEGKDTLEFVLTDAEVRAKGSQVQREYFENLQKLLKLGKSMISSDRQIALAYRQNKAGLDSIPEKYMDFAA